MSVKFTTCKTTSTMRKCMIRGPVKRLQSIPKVYMAVKTVENTRSSTILLMTDVLGTAAFWYAIGECVCTKSRKDKRNIETNNVNGSETVDG